MFRDKGTKQRKGLHELIDQINSDTVMVELGSANGESSIMFAEKVKHITCVDVWMNSTADREKIFDETIKGYENITKLKTNSIEALKYFEDKSLDGIYIDANHSYEYVVEDLRQWRQKIKDTGFIAGHDYTFKFIGVIQAIHELYDKPDHVFCDGSWIIYLDKLYDNNSNSIL